MKESFSSSLFVCLSQLVIKNGGDVVGTDTVTQDAGAQTGEAEVAYAAIPSPWIGVPLSHLAWLAAKQPPFNVFPDFV